MPGRTPIWATQNTNVRRIRSARTSEIWVRRRAASSVILRSSLAASSVTRVPNFDGSR